MGSLRGKNFHGSIETIDALRQKYNTAGGRAVTKEHSRIEKHTRRFLALSPFLVIASSANDGLADASPRGEAPGFVQVLDDQTIAIPDRPGNNRLDTLENILANPEIGLIFFIPGVNETLRINGRAEIRDDADLLQRFEVQGKLPATVLVVHIQAIYLHCAKALMRSNLWHADMLPDQRPIPSMGQMINDQINSDAEVEPETEMVERYRKTLY